MARIDMNKPAILPELLIVRVARAKLLRPAQNKFHAGIYRPYFFHFQVIGHINQNKLF